MWHIVYIVAIPFYSIYLDLHYDIDIWRKAIQEAIVCLLTTQ